MGSSHHAGRRCGALRRARGGRPDGAARRAQDGDDEQDGNGHIRADEGGGEERGHDVEGGR